LPRLIDEQSFWITKFFEWMNLPYFGFVLQIFRFEKMPRTYRRRTVQTYTEAELQQRLSDYKASLETDHPMTLREACKINGVEKIPPATFSRRLRGMNCKRVGRGRTTVLTPEEEEYLVYGIQCLSEYGWGLGPDMLKEIVANFIQFRQIKTPFKNGIPGDDWLAGFRRRWKHCLSLRTPEYLSAA
jgi:hypothetical protein